MNKSEIELSHADKVYLLQSIQRGRLDLSYFERAEEAMTPERINDELDRLAMFADEAEARRYCPIFIQNGFCRYNSDRETDCK